MNCKVEWNDDFIESNFTKVFMKERYLPEKTKLLIDREKAMLPETQPIVEILKNKNVIIDTIEKLKNRKHELYDMLRDIDGEIQWNYRKMSNAQDAHDAKRFMKTTETPKKEFVQKCPSDDCNGFLSTAWKCGICQVNVCSKCHKIKDFTNEHVCDPNDVKSVQLIKSDSKPCPKCSALIFKIDGCNQMWCTKCHVAFNWRTLEIEVGRVHNPEYFRWMRESGGGMPREEDRLCDGNLIAYYPLHMSLQSLKPGNDIFSDSYVNWDKMYRGIIECYREMNHLRFYELPRFEDNNSQVKKQSMRIRFMMNSLTEEDWLKQLMTMQKINKRKHDYRMLIEMVTQCISDSLIIQMTNKEFNIEPLNKIIHYYNENMTKISQKYSTKTLLMKQIHIS
tara:strand:+ start:1218 stop:2396 length:1179 start_codon:yes stop_codon:yes gene_type:complete